MQEIISINPSNEEVYGRIQSTPLSEIDEIVNIAIKDNKWKNKKTEDRVKIIEQIIPLLEKAKESLARTMAGEMGKPIKEGRHEVDISIKRIQAYCRQIPLFIEDEIIFEDEAEKNIVTFTLLNAVGIISPWNAPVFLPLAMIIPALLCGNNVIWKPSEYTGFTGIELNKIFDSLKEKGLSNESFQMIVGGKETGEHLVKSDVDLIALTGSVNTGKQVMEVSSEKLHRIIFELGGKDPALILEDTDLDKAAKEIVKSSTMFTGQVCFGVERVYCHSSVYDEFVKKCIEETKKLIVGNPFDEKTDIGPFAVKFQIEKVLEHINDAVKKGAKILYGGNKIGERGFFMAPGVMVDVNHDMKIMKEETFGPITPIMKVDNEDEMIKLANDSVYGLTASIWTKDINKAEILARKIDAGTVEINRHGMSKAGCPWGGCKLSGIGRIYSKEGIREFCNIKHIWTLK